ncbi:MAG: M20/M25/M40 family metallo-hydrolase [Atopobiaceae bacterium]|nr:M20/M25/M40 family metallo-hydrolase [Atopobiaceae bacterium]
MDQKTARYVKNFAHAHHAEALELLKVLARIPAPSHHEERRAEFVRNWMHAARMTDAFIDDATSVICPIQDDGTSDLVVFAAHTDVVFPDTDELPLVERDGRLYAPGVGDDTANLVILLLAARHLAQHPELLPSGLGMLVVANSCEEGLGNLKGTRALFERFGTRIKRYYSLDLYLPGIVSTAVGSHRWQITVQTQGGHSFRDFGRPNAIERLCALIGELYSMQLPDGIPTTINVGTVEGGTTINAIAAKASCLFEYRSTSDEVMQDLRSQMMQVLARYRTDEVEVTATEVGARPASVGTRSLELESMTQVSCDIVRTITGEEPNDAPSSTDANIPLSLGIPANTVGAVRGALLHTRDEWVDMASVEEGLAVALGLMLAQNRLD